ncbi:MAG: PASTA domain-containing protein [Planctomycetaceae bacterium]|nr:PASTA domain-containing protein [Planctomycetaceae bacterium]
MPNNHALVATFLRSARRIAWLGLFASASLLTATSTAAEPRSSVSADADKAEDADSDEQARPQPAVVSVETRPTKVRVPRIEHRTLEVYVRRLNELGLSVAADGKLFASDRLIGTKPTKDEWVAAGSSIAVEIERVVPDVTKLKAIDAVSALRKKEFAAGPTHEGKYRNGDIVTDQFPAAGEYRSRGTKIRLTIERSSSTDDDDEAAR